MFLIVQSGPLVGINGVITPLYSLIHGNWVSNPSHLVGHVQQNPQEVSFLTYGNAIFILIFLRTVVPRLLVFLGCEISKMGGMKPLGGWDETLGLPK